MEEEIRREALRQYLKYFRIWFIITGIVLVVTIGAVAVRAVQSRAPRGNSEAPVERVYDEAEVLTDEEEEQLRQFIAECERKAQIDIVIVTTRRYMGDSDWEWNDAMMTYADDFYDDGKYGWDRAYGDGALLLDNWYEDEKGSQKGAWLSTSGKMERNIGAWEEGEVFDAMDVYIEDNPYMAYRAAVKSLAGFGSVQAVSVNISNLCCIWVLPFVIALIYAAVHMAQSKAKDTTVAATYVENGRPVLRSKSDTFIRKHVASHRIETSSGGSSGGGHRGGGSAGSHSSSSGHSHGGGGRRR